MFSVNISPRLSYPNRFISAGNTVWMPLRDGVIPGKVTSITDISGITLTTRHPMSMVKNVEIDHIIFFNYGDFALNKADAVLHHETRKRLREARRDIYNSPIGYESLRRHYRIQKRRASVVITLKDTDKDVAIKAIKSAMKHTYKYTVPYCFEIIPKESGKAWLKFYFNPSETNDVPPTLYIKSLRQSDRDGMANVIYNAGFYRYTPEYFGNVENDIVYYW